MNADLRLEVKDLHVSIDGNPIIKGLSLAVGRGQVHAIMGPNGSGKSTFANALMGNPRYVIEHGIVKLDGQDLLGLRPDERARLGMFLAFQYPAEIPGVSVANFLRTAYNAVYGREKEMSVLEFHLFLAEKMKLLGMDESFARRHLNEGFSGGEKKRHEILQMAVLQPRLAILDEPDSGLDIDALQTVAEGVNALRGEDMSVLVITHYPRILRYLQPDYVHVVLDGHIVRSGGPQLADQLDEQGYDWLKREAEIA